MTEEDFEKIDIATGRLVDAHREMRKAFFDKIKEFEEENQKLRDLLISCKYCVATLKSKGVSDCSGVKLPELLTKIDEVLK